MITIRSLYLYLVDDVSFNFLNRFVVSLLFTVFIWVINNKLSSEVLKEQQLEYLAITDSEDCLKKIELSKTSKLSQEGRDCHAEIMFILAGANCKLDEDFFINNMKDNKILLSQSAFKVFSQEMVNKSPYEKMLLESYIQIS